MEETCASGRGMRPGHSPESSSIQNYCRLAMETKLCSQTGKTVVEDSYFKFLGDYCITHYTWSLDLHSLCARKEAY